MEQLGDSSEQARMINMQQDARKNTDTLEEARRELMGTEKNAEDTMEELYRQRGTIEKIKGNLIAGNTLLGRYVLDIFKYIADRYKIMNINHCEYRWEYIQCTEWEEQYSRWEGERLV